MSTMAPRGAEEAAPGPGRDVAAALAVLEQAASERETAQERIHARAAHALVAQALADAGQAARLALLHEANDVLCGGLSSVLNLEHMRDMHDRVLLAGARATIARLEGIVQAIASSGIELDDARLRYVTVQIDRDAWSALRAAVGAA